MASFKNVQGITVIELFGKTHNFCPMGNDWYDADVKVIFEPSDTIMDYCDVDKFFESINNADLIIEDVVSQTFDYFNTYEPESLTVTAKVDNATHLPVVVTKSI